MRECVPLHFPFTVRRRHPEFFFSDVHRHFTLQGFRSAKLTSKSEAPQETAPNYKEDAIGYTQGSPGPNGSNQEQSAKKNLGLAPAKKRSHCPLASIEELIASASTSALQRILPLSERTLFAWPRILRFLYSSLVTRHWLFYLSPVGTMPAFSTIKITARFGARVRCWTPRDTTNPCRGSSSIVRPSRSISSFPSTT